MKIRRVVAVLALAALLGGVLSLPTPPSLQAQPQSALQVSPTSLSFNSQAGGQQPDARFLTLDNTGTKVLKWRASTDVDWIILGASTARIGPGQVVKLLVLVDTQGLASGTRRGTITVENADAQDSATEVAVTLTLSKPALLDVSPSSLSFSAQEGGSNPSSQTLTIKNTGGEPLNWTASTAATWLILRPSQGGLTTGSSASVSVEVDLSGLSVGSHKAEITVRSDEATNNPVNVAVALTLRVAASPQPSGSITIGAILPLTGALGSFGPRFQVAAQLAVDEVNRAGGLLNGSLVRLDVRDGGTNPDTAVAAASQLVNEVEVIFGAAASGVTIPISSVTIPNRVVLISPSATSPAMTTLNDNDFVFRTGPSDALQGFVLAELAVSKGYHRVAIIARNDAYGAGLASVFKQSFEARGRTITNVVPYDPSTTNFSSQIASARSGNPDAISLITFDEGEPLITQMVAAGVTNFDLFVDGNKNQDLFNRVANSIGTVKLEDKVGTAQASDPVARGAATFGAAYRARLSEDPFVFTPQSYDALALILLAIEKAGKYDGPAIRDALRSVANPPGEVVTVGQLGKALEILRGGGDINYEGVSGSVDFDDNGDVPGFIGTWALSNGKIVEQSTLYSCSSASGSVQCNRQ